MQTFDFKSIVMSNEINLNGIALHFGINKKFKWKESLILGEKNLEGIVLHPANKFVYLFHFGSMVFVNLTFHEMQDIIGYLKTIDKNPLDADPFNYTEDFKLEIDTSLNSEGEDRLIFEINYNSITLNKLNSYIIDIISTVIAKSVALEKIEHDIDTILDEIENVIVFLDKGRLDLSDKQLAKLSGKVLRFKYNTISYLMLFEKPDIAWKNEGAEDIFQQLSTLFELKERYENIRNKSEILLDITEVFTSLTHAKRGTKLEWAVIILIGFEIILFGADIILSLSGKLF